MGWFGKKEKEVIPSLPELPKLPELPRSNENEGIKKIHQLPSFPNNSLGQKFSQDTIKDAVTGKKEDNWGFGTNNFAEEEMQRIPKLPEEKIPKKTFPIIKGIPKEFQNIPTRIRKVEPIFIRIDKFEESLKNLENIQNQIIEIEKMVQETKSIREKEEIEIEAWDNELKIIKTELENIDKNVFSKIE